MFKTLKSTTVSTGLAMFSMFFGAGNIVFPLALGQYAQDSSIYAILGLLLSAVAVPFLGLITMLIYDGKYQDFFGRIGKVPGFIVAAVIMAIIGPLGAIPRCVALTYSTMDLFIPGMSFWIFSLVSCVLIYVLTYSKSALVELLGYVLTPLLILSLVVIVVKGLWGAPQAPELGLDPQHAFLTGLTQGYQTMDLIGAFFFSTVVLLCLQDETHPQGVRDENKLIAMSLKASLIGAMLLAAVYIGFCLLAAAHALELQSVKADVLLGTLALKVLGPYAGIIASVAAALACLTTAMALAAVFAEFLKVDIFRDRVNYHWALGITLLIAFFVSTLHFDGIVATLAPILEAIYPALIVLTICNLLYKFYSFTWVKTPVLLTFVATLAYRFIA